MIETNLMKWAGQVGVGKELREYCGSLHTKQKRPLEKEAGWGNL
jgi:hypothetical protein